MSALLWSGPDAFLGLLHWKVPLTSSTVMEILSVSEGEIVVYTFIEVGSLNKMTEFFFLANLQT